MYNNFKTTNQVDDQVLESIARRDLEGIDLTEREVEIMTQYASQISDIQSIIEDERARAEENNAPIQEAEEEVVPQVLEQEEDVQEETTDPLAGSVSGAQSAAAGTDALFEQLYGTGKDGTNKDENEQEPFVVEGNPEDGFDVVSRNGITLTDEKIDSEEKANDLANELNNSRTDIDWTRLFLGDLTSFEEPTYKVDQMVRRGQISLRAYNKNNETQIETLEDYYKIPEGKRNLDDIKESVLTGVPLNKIKQKRKKAAREEQEQLDLFEDTTSGFVGGPALPLQSVQDLFDRLESATAETPQTSSSVDERKAKSLGMFNIIPNFRDDSGYVGTYYTPMGTEEIIEGLTYEDVQSKLEAKYNSEISEKIGKFVKEDTVSEESILDQLRKINSCFK